MSGGFALFDTPIGRCGIAWGPAGLRGVQLPEGSEAKTRARLVARFPEVTEREPPATIAAAIVAIAGVLRGEAPDLASIELDLGPVPEFHRKVYSAARAIPPGTTVSYGELAARVGAPGAARAVGQALGKNPFAVVVPCHRVLAAGGKSGGFSANGGVDTKLRMLSLERMTAPSDGELGFDPADAERHLRQQDPAFTRMIDLVGPIRMKLKRASSPFFALAEAIVYQQLTGKAAKTIFGRVCALCPDGLTAEAILATPEGALRGAGLSRNKLLSLRDLAARAERGEIPDFAAVRRLDNEAIIERLTPVRGIGRWTVEMFLIFYLGRPDVLPLDDYGVRKGFAVAFKKRELPDKKAVARRGARWSPYRTAASWYLWRASERATPR